MSAATNTGRGRAERKPVVRHILPLDGADLKRLENLCGHLFSEPDEEAMRADAARALDWLIFANGCKHLAAAGMREIWKFQRSAGFPPCVAFAPFFTTKGGDRLAYAMVNGVDGVILKCLADTWHESREDALARCIPRTGAEIAALRRADASVRLGAGAIDADGKGGWGDVRKGD